MFIASDIDTSSVILNLLFSKMKCLIILNQIISVQTDIDSFPKKNYLRKANHIKKEN